MFPLYVTPKPLKTKQRLSVFPLWGMGSVMISGAFVKDFRDRSLRIRSRAGRHTWGVLYPSLSHHALRAFLLTEACLTCGADLRNGEIVTYCKDFFPFHFPRVGICDAGFDLATKCIEDLSPDVPDLIQSLGRLLSLKSRVALSKGLCVLGKSLPRKQINSCMHTCVFLSFCCVC